MGQSIAGKGQSTQNIAIFSIKSTFSLHLFYLLIKKVTVERQFPKNWYFKHFEKCPGSRVVSDSVTISY